MTRRELHAWVEKQGRAGEVAAARVVEVPSEVPTIAEAIEKLGIDGGTVVVLPGHVEP